MIYNITQTFGVINFLKRFDKSLNTVLKAREITNAKIIESIEPAL